MSSRNKRKKRRDTENNGYDKDINFVMEMVDFEMEMADFEKEMNDFGKEMDKFEEETLGKSVEESEEGDVVEVLEEGKCEYKKETAEEIMQEVVGDLNGFYGEEDGEDALVEEKEFIELDEPDGFEDTFDVFNSIANKKEERVQNALNEMYRTKGYLNIIREVEGEFGKGNEGVGCMGIIDDLITVLIENGKSVDDSAKLCKILGKNLGKLVTLDMI